MLRFEVDGGNRIRDCGGLVSNGEFSKVCFSPDAGGTVFKLGAGVTLCSVPPGAPTGRGEATGAGRYVESDGAGMYVLADTGAQQRGAAITAGA
ncbi:MAG: hypothetical protein IIA67_12305 [Planctomycetes bacterium]|nr:hypothetical protein [Planctomycetota bacterium]